MMTIFVCEFLETSHLLSPDKGSKLRERISELISDKIKVVTDFDGYKYISSSFLNEAFGKLLIDNNWSIDELRNHVEWVNLEEDDEIDFKVALDNAASRLRLLKQNIDPQEFYRKHLPTL